MNEIETLIFVLEMVGIAAFAVSGVMVAAARELDVLGALVLGLGMCLAMEISGSLMPLGIVIGVVGIAMVAANYPIYSAIMRSRRKKYAQRILALSDELLQNDR